MLLTILHVIDIRCNNNTNGNTIIFLYWYNRTWWIQRIINILSLHYPLNLNQSNTLVRSCLNFHCRESFFFNVIIMAHRKLCFFITTREIMLICIFLGL